MRFCCPNRSISSESEGKGDGILDEGSDTSRFLPPGHRKPKGFPSRQKKVGNPDGNDNVDLGTSTPETKSHPMDPGTSSMSPGEEVTEVQDPEDEADEDEAHDDPDGTGNEIDEDEFMNR